MKIGGKAWWKILENRSEIREKVCPPGFPGSFPRGFPLSFVREFAGSESKTP
jgi:hypothetical protein